MMERFYRYWHWAVVLTFAIAALAAVLIPGRLVKASHSLVRTDISNEDPSSHDFCVPGNLTSDYIANRYITIGDATPSNKVTSSTAPGEVGNSCFSSGDTMVSLENVSPRPTNGDTVKLWTSDPNASHDTTPPTISNLTANSITQTGATITWTTNESASHTVKYSTTSGSYDSYPNSKSAGSGTSASGAL